MTRYDTQTNDTHNKTTTEEKINKLCAFGHSSNRSIESAAIETAIYVWSIAKQWFTHANTTRVQASNGY